VDVGGLGWAFPFNDGFETGDSSAWDGYGGADPTINGTAAIIGSYGMDVDYITDGYDYLQWTNTTWQIYRVKFYVNQNDLSGTGGDNIAIVQFLDGAISSGIVQIVYDGAGVSWSIRVQMRNDAGGWDTGSHNDIGSGDILVEAEFVWMDTSGYVNIWINGSPANGLTGVDSGIRFPDEVRFGHAISSPDPDSGGIFVDEFTLYNSRRPLEISESDSIAVGDTVIDISVVGAEPDRNVTETDGITIGESVIATLDDLIVDESDDITFGESITTTLGDLVVNVSDDITVNDVDSELLVALILETDDITVGENVVNSLDDLAISETDDITIGDAPGVSVVDAGAYVIGESDDISFGENVTTSLDDLVINESDGLTVGDDPTINVGEAGAIEISETDGITIGDSEIVSLGTPGDRGVGETDGITFGESVSATISDPSIFETDGITIGDVATVSLEVVGDLSISESDGLTLGDNVTTSLDDLTMAVSDSVTIADVPELALLIGVVESWTLQTRGTAWTLEDKDQDWSLRERSTAWTVEDR
jgi:hypothetical protein